MNASAIYPSGPGEPGEERHLKGKDLDRAVGTDPDPHLPLACNDEECFVTTSELDAHDEVPEPDPNRR